MVLHQVHRILTLCDQPPLLLLLLLLLPLQLEGEISDQLKGRFAPGLSVPQICDALEKAALDPRIAGVAVEINPLAVSPKWSNLLHSANPQSSIAWGDIQKSNLAGLL